jgi:hypothetical protein
MWPPILYFEPGIVVEAPTKDQFPSAMMVARLVPPPPLPLLAVLPPHATIVKIRAVAVIARAANLTDFVLSFVVMGCFRSFHPLSFPDQSAIALATTSSVDIGAPKASRWVMGTGSGMGTNCGESNRRQEERQTKDADPDAHILKEAKGVVRTAGIEA